MGEPENHPYAQAAEAIARRFGKAPKVAVILGSGAGGLRDALQSAESEGYGAIGLPTTSVVGHQGELIVGQLGQTKVAMLAGRIHAYEGRSMEESVRAVRAMAAWGVEVLLMTSAVGSLHTGLSPGDLVQITDHINLMGINPLVGPNIDELGPRFPDLAQAYDPELARQAHSTAQEMGVDLHSGVYAAVRGPSFETPAEVRMLGQMGAAVVGMSVVPETIAAVHAGMRVLTIAIVSNEGTGLSETPPNHADVTATVGRAASRLCPLLERLVSEW